MSGSPGGEAEIRRGSAIMARLHHEVMRPPERAAARQTAGTRRREARRRAHQPRKPGAWHAGEGRSRR